MIENLSRAPFAIGMTRKFGRRHAVNCFSYGRAQLLESIVHRLFSRMTPDTPGRKIFFQKRAFMKRLALVLLSLAVASGCTSGSNPPTGKARLGEPLTGRSALQQLFISARGWAPDARHDQLRYQAGPDSKG